MPVKLKQVQRKSQNTCNHMFISRIKRLNMRLDILKLNRSRHFERDSKRELLNMNLGVFLLNVEICAHIFRGNLLGRQV